jgi:uncharacterized protein (DUF1330 family)
MWRCSQRITGPHYRFRQRARSIWWPGDRVVILAFDDRDAFTTWLNSPEYQAIVKDRRAAAKTTILLVRGVD